MGGKENAQGWGKSVRNEVGRGVRGNRGGRGKELSEGVKKTGNRKRGQGGSKE